MTSQMQEELDGYTPVENLGQFDESLGPYFVKETSDDSSLCAFKTDSRHSNIYGRLHGGVMMSFADFTIFQAVENSIDGQHAVIAFSSEFVSSGAVGDLVMGVAECTRVTRSVIFLKGQLKADDNILLTFSAVVKRKED